MSDSSASLPSRGGLRSKFVRFALTVIIAAVLGPLIAGGTYFAVFAAMLIVQSGFHLGGLAEQFIIMIGVAYLAGGIIALVAGLIVAVAALWREPTFLGIIAAVVVANIAYFAITEPEVFYSTAATIPLQELFVDLVFSVYAGTICWLLFRRLLKNT